jgi:hypothetical protein
MIRKDQHKSKREWQSMISNHQQNAMTEDMQTTHLGHQIYLGTPQIASNLMGKTAGQHCLRVNFA